MPASRLLLLITLLVVAAVSAGPPVRTAQRVVSVPCDPLPDECAPPIAIPHCPPPPCLPSTPFLPPVPAVGEGQDLTAELPTPFVSLKVRVAPTSAVGQELEYRLIVTNPSRAAAHHVTVRNPIPKNAEFVRANPPPTAQSPELVWRLGTLQPGQSKELSLVLRPTGGDVDNCARVAFEHGQCVTTRMGGTARGAMEPPGPMNPSLTVRKTAPAQVVLYDPVTFRIEVVNNGPVPINEIIVTDILPREFRFETATPATDRRELLTWTLGTLQPGEQRVIEYRAISMQEGTFTNRAVVNAAGGIRQEASSQVAIGKGKLSLSMMGPAKRYANLPAVYEITISNPGNAAANNVVVVNPLPMNTRFVNASDMAQQADNEIRWMVGTLAPGAKKTLKLQLAATAAGEVVNRATVKADRDLTANAEARTLFQGVAGITARLTDTDPIEVGQEVAYVLVVKNTGTEMANEVKVTAIIPAQLQATDSQGPSKATLLVDKVTFEPVALKAGEELRYLFYVKALKPGDVRFRVDIEAKELTAGPLREEESTTIFDDTPP